MATSRVTADRLLKDAAKHQMTVLMDSGIYRHLMFRQPQNSNQWWFEIVTWPGSLTINGDMGTWSFARIDDMFKFFRSTKELKINSQYWEEKITSESRFGGPAKKFNADTFKDNVINSLDGYDLSKTQTQKIIQSLKDTVFCEDEYPMRQALAEFRFAEFTFSDSWEIDGNTYTYHFLWCLYAIVWAIQQYDAANAAPAPVNPSPEAKHA
jgi:hypothetical protein